MWHFFTRNMSSEQREDFEAALEPPPELPQGQEHIPGTAPRNMRAPSWWKGDRAAYRSSSRAMDEVRRLESGMGDTAATSGHPVGAGGRRRPPVPGRR